MADLLQRLVYGPRINAHKRRPAFLCVLAVFACCAGEATDFPHALHLSLDLNCKSCHSPALTSAKTEDNLLPKPSVCLQCHGDGDVQVPAPPTTKIAHFSHAQHLKMGNIAPVIAAAIDKGTYLSAPGNIRPLLNTKNTCGACHRGVERSAKVAASLLPRMADCLVCHSEIDPPDSCAKCHAPGLTLKPVNHTDDFLDSHTSAPNKESCAVCHGRKFHCLGCHTK